MNFKNKSKTHFTLASESPSSPSYSEQIQMTEKKEAPKETPSEAPFSQSSYNLWDEIKSTTKLEDWVASYLGVLGSLIIIIIYVCDPSMGEISMNKWDTNPFDTFKTGSNGTYWIIFIVFFCMFVLWVSFVFFLIKNKFFFYQIKISSLLLNKDFSFVGIIALSFISMVSKILGNQTLLADSGVNASVWALIFGFVLANTVFWKYMELPSWIGDVQKFQEYYIKLGLVCLAIDFSSLINLGYRGIVVGWVFKLSIKNYFCLRSIQ